MKHNEHKYFTPFNQYSTSRNCQSVELRNIMNDVKHLQKCIQQLNIFEGEQSQIVPPTPLKNKTQSRHSHKSINNSCKSSKIKQNSVRTIRKEHQLSQNDSLILKRNTQSCKPCNASKTINCFKNQYSSTGRDQLFGLPSDYISLRMQNLKLQKQNLILENKLLQQQLLMERREKELLKNRLKRIKTFNSSKREDKKLESGQKQAINAICPKVNAFDFSPIKIKAPLKYEQTANPKHNKENQNTKKNKASQVNSSIDGKNQQQLMDSLLLSVSNRSQHKQLKGIFSKEGWQFAEKNERVTLSDISNKSNVSAKKCQI